MKKEQLLENGLAVTKDDMMAFDSAGFVIRQGNAINCGVVTCWNVLNHFGLVKPTFSNFFDLWADMVEQDFALPDGTTSNISQQRMMEQIGFVVADLGLRKIDKVLLEKDINNPMVCAAFGVEGERFWSNSNSEDDVKPDHVIFITSAGKKTFSGIDSSTGRKRWDKEVVYRNSAGVMLFTPGEELLKFMREGCD